MKLLLTSLVFEPKSSSSGSSMYRPQAVKFYAGQSIASEGGSLLCSVSGCEVPAADIVAGHICQQRWPILVSGTTEFNVETGCFA